MRADGRGGGFVASSECANDAIARPHDLDGLGRQVAEHVRLDPVDRAVAPGEDLEALGA